MDNLERYTILSGIRIQVLARAVACNKTFARQLHERLASHLNRICMALRIEMARAAGETSDKGFWDYTPFRLADDQIHLIDTLYIDHETGECQVNGGEWISSRPDGYITMVSATDEEIEGLGRFIVDLATLGIHVTADHARFVDAEVSLAA